MFITAISRNNFIESNKKNNSYGEIMYDDENYSSDINYKGIIVMILLILIYIYLLYNIS